MADMRQTPRESRDGESEEVWRKSGLAWTMEDHRRMGSSGPGEEAALRDPSKTMGENMTDDELKAYMEKRIADVREQYQRTLKNSTELRFLKLFLEQLIPDMAYVKHVGRLPQLLNFDPEKEFRIPTE